MSERDESVWQNVRGYWPQALCLALILVTRASFADQYTVPSESMLPTVHAGDRVFVAKAAFGLRVPLTTHYLVRFDAPARGDVVVLQSPVEDTVLLKRVIAVPGDRVAVHDGQVSIDGRVIPMDGRGALRIERFDGHTHEVSLAYGGGPDFESLVPADHYLVMGDNRGNSRDGRYFGLVERSSILGRASGVFLRDGAPTWRGL